MPTYILYRQKKRGKALRTIIWGIRGWIYGNPLSELTHYEIYLSDVSLQPALVTYLESIEDIRRINKSEVTAMTLSGINALIAYVSLGIIGILFAVSIFLISNTVTIGISVRKEEINIMKYIGATDFLSVLHLLSKG